MHSVVQAEVEEGQNVRCADLLKLIFADVEDDLLDDRVQSAVLIERERSLEEALVDE